MKHGQSLKWLSLMVLAMFAAIVAAGLIQISWAQSSIGDPWRFAVTPYFWFINLEGNLRYSPIAGGSPHVNVSNSDLLDNLDFGFMFSGEARKGRCSIFTDVIYFDLSSMKSRVIVFPAKGQTQEQMEKDKYECYGWAKQQTGFDPMLSQPTAQAAPAPSQGPQGERIRGAARGAAVGAVVGGIANDDAGKGAAAGAAGGVMVGGMKTRQSRRQQAQAQQQQSQQQDAAYEQKHSTYNRAYSACLEGKGYAVK